MCKYAMRVEGNGVVLCPMAKQKSEKERLEKRAVDLGLKDDARTYENGSNAPIQ